MHLDLFAKRVPWRARRSALAFSVSAGVACFAFALCPGIASARTVECQHPVTTGELAVNVRHVSAAVACGIVRAIPGYEAKSHREHLTPLFRCVGGNRVTGQVSHPVTALHHFRRWRVGVVDGLLKFWRGDSSFSVSGTDFGAYCGN